jgi:hypothetical protein
MALAMLLALAAPLAVQPQPLIPEPSAAATQPPPVAAVPVEPVAGTTLPDTPPSPQTAASPDAATRFAEEDVLGAAEDVFGKGVEGIAEAIRKTFADRGQPNAYIVGREAGGAFIVGVRYGSGTLHHKVEGEQPVHWTGPSVGVDVGADGSKVFALVYNLDDTEDLFNRFAGGGGKAYFVGGVAVDYLYHEKVVVVPIKLGVGLRLGLQGGYTKFSKKGDFNPF